MKIIPLVLVLLLAGRLLNAQDATPDTSQPNSKIGLLLNAPSQLAEWQEYYLGKIGGTGKVDIYAVKMYYPALGDTNYAIKFKVSESGQYGKIRVAMVDVDEIPGLLNALRYLSTFAVISNQKAGEFERNSSFKTKDGFVVGYNCCNAFGGFCHAGALSAAWMFMTLENYDKMIGMIQLGIQMLGLPEVTE